MVQSRSSGRVSSQDRSGPAAVCGSKVATPLDIIESYLENYPDAPVASN